MSVAEKLQDVAAEIAHRMELRLSDLDREEAEIDGGKAPISAERKAQILAERKAIRPVSKRLASFHAKIDIFYQCPRCWIENEKRSTLSPISDTNQKERFRCRVCRLELEN